MKSLVARLGEVPEGCPPICEWVRPMSNFTNSCVAIVGKQAAKETPVLRVLSWKIDGNTPAALDQYGDILYSVETNIKMISPTHQGISSACQTSSVGLATFNVCVTIYALKLVQKCDTMAFGYHEAAAWTKWISKMLLGHS